MLLKCSAEQDGILTWSLICTLFYMTLQVKPFIEFGQDSEVIVFGQKLRIPLRIWSFFTFCILTILYIQDSLLIQDNQRNYKGHSWSRLLLHLTNGASPVYKLSVCRASSNFCSVLPDVSRTASFYLHIVTNMWSRSQTHPQTHKHQNWLWQILPTVTCNRSKYNSMLCFWRRGHRD